MSSFNRYFWELNRKTLERKAGNIPAKVAVNLQSALTNNQRPNDWSKTVESKAVIGFLAHLACGVLSISVRPSISSPSNRSSEDFIVVIEVKINK